MHQSIKYSAQATVGANGVFGVFCLLDNLNSINYLALQVLLGYYRNNLFSNYDICEVVRLWCWLCLQIMANSDGVFVMAKILRER
jgi:hypothetical protein